MARYSRGRYWSMSVLKERGWTGELVRELLPKPEYVYQGRPIRVWEKTAGCAGRPGQSCRAGGRTGLPAAAGVLGGGRAGWFPGVAPGGTLS